MAKKKDRTSRFQKIQEALFEETPFGAQMAVPPHLALANPKGGGMQVQFYHIATKKYAEFAAFITGFSDSFNSNWNSQEVYGRMDPIMNFKNTTRSISLSLEVPSFSTAEARSNLAEINALIQMLYPTYAGGIIDGAPLVKVQFQNIIMGGKSNSALNAVGIDAKDHGLYAAIMSLNATPDFDAGVLGRQIDNAESPFNASFYGGISLPKKWSIDLSLNILHDHSMSSNMLNSMAFPYGGIAQDVENKGNEEDTEAPPPENTSDPTVGGETNEQMKSAGVGNQPPPAPNGTEGSPTNVKGASKPGTPGASATAEKKTTVKVAGMEVGSINENTSVSVAGIKIK